MKQAAVRLTAYRQDCPSNDSDNTVGDFVGATAEDWKKKYFDSLGSLEKEQQHYRAIEAALKRLAGRLCAASLGHSSRLDEELRTLQGALRRETSADELDRITAKLTDAINDADRSSPSAPKLHVASGSSNELPDNERVRAVLSALIAELRRDPELTLQVDALDAKLSTSMTHESLPDLLTSLSELVGQRIRRIERAKQEVEGLLTHMVGRLDEIGQFVAAQNRNQDQSLASSETFNVQLVGEMKAMGASVESAADLSQVRSQVRARLDSIDRHLVEFRARETDRAKEMRAQNDKMRARVSELEAEATRLQSQLQDEQRQSTLDGLTKIPNRLAYEKRMDEELQRFKRFKQPTCIAMWDVDHFKRVNDTYGHRAGDKVLTAVAECLASRIRTTDFIARYGGEEFAMILCGAKIDDALRIAEEMRIAVSKIKMHSGGTPLIATITCGLTELQAGDTAVAAFDRADKALYRGKEAGRNRCVGG